ncbi:melanocortin receptor 3-like isoform X2 [Varroa jacobsoni]|uniref:melanocortin receptor 3-like isoform X2 n=1 Tax=Varroa jacobsoni TaxID=62625 RepID=UPI000BF8F38C|nr:melanocortin receptor 3-like isoform X2 [Varroa jacobsoni]
MYASFTWKSGRVINVADGVCSCLHLQYFRQNHHKVKLLVGYSSDWKNTVPINRFKRLFRYHVVVAFVSRLDVDCGMPDVPYSTLSTTLSAGPTPLLLLLTMLPEHFADRLPAIILVQADSTLPSVFKAYSVKGIDDGDLNSSEPCDLNSSSSVAFEHLQLNNCTLVRGNGDIEDPNFAEVRMILYQWLVVISSLGMLASVFINLLVLFSARYIRKITPTVFFSLSLVAANAYAVITCTGSMAVNSFLPVVYEWSPNICWALLLEVFRMTGLTSSALHLLALAINHYVGILRPLHYASTITRRRLTLVIVALWVIPFVTYALIILNHPENDFRHLHCNYEFMTHLPYRVTVSSLFFAPLVIMTILYIHIFITVKRNHNSFLMGQKNQVGGNQLHIKRNVKAVITTLLILGTYLIGYMPAIVFYALTCDECPCPLNSLDVRTRTGFGIATNSLIFVKCLCDPIIYTVRMPEVRSGLRRMWLTGCWSKYLPTAAIDTDRKRTMTSLRSDTIPLNRRSLQDHRERRQLFANSDHGHLHNSPQTGHKHLCARTSLHSPDQAVTALA